MKNCKCQSSGLKKILILSSASVSALSRGKLSHENARSYLVIFSICLFYVLVKGKLLPSTIGSFLTSTTG